MSWPDQNWPTVYKHELDTVCNVMDVQIYLKLIFIYIS